MAYLTSCCIIEISGSPTTFSVFSRDHNAIHKMIYRKLTLFTQLHVQCEMDLFEEVANICDLVVLLPTYLLSPIFPFQSQPEVSTLKIHTCQLCGVHMGRQWEGVYQQRRCMCALGVFVSVASLTGRPPIQMYAGEIESVQLVCQGSNIVGLNIEREDGRLPFPSWNCFILSQRLLS